MRIIEWNCQGAFRKKHSKILALNPDIIIVPECESEEKLNFGETTPKPNDFVWYGNSSNKGIGVFSYSDCKFEQLKTFNPRFRYIIPIKVSCKERSFLLFAVWAMNNKQVPEEGYIGQIWMAINYYSSYFKLPCILVGDFNSNKIWDKKDRKGNHTDVVNYLEKNEIYSLYHHQESIEQGKENHPTFHLYRNIEKPYHIDYFFVSKPILESNYKLKIGVTADWVGLSDHNPLILDFDSKLKLTEFNYSYQNFIEDKCKAISNETKKRFNDVISDLLEIANKIDNSIDSNSILQLKSELNLKYESLVNIDGQIKKMFNEL